MIKISKTERDYLVNVCKVPTGENGVSRTHGKHVRYYLCTSTRNMDLLKKFRESSIVEK